MKVPCVYILASQRDGIQYVGVTSDLADRLSKHSQGMVEGFTKRHRIKQLVYYEMHQTMLEAIAREKQLKHWNRAWKVRLIKSFNPEWRNLFDTSSGQIASGPADDQRTENRAGTYRRP